MCLILENGSAVPLKSVKVEASVVDLVGKVCVEQVFERIEGHDSLEVIYKFPLDDAAAVYAFEADVDDERVVGVVKEKNEASAHYKSALSGGTFAAIVDDETTDVFQIRLGNFKKRVVVRLSYATVLKYEAGHAVFFVPTTIAPRYDGVGGVEKEEARQGFDSAVTEESHYAVSLTLDCSGASVSSPSGHEFSVAADGSVSLSAATMDRDIVFNIALASDRDTSAVCQPTADGFVSMVTYYPRIDDALKQKVELIFLIDRSGSMKGKAIFQAKQAMEIILHSIPADAYFNIIGFGENFNELFYGSVKYSEETLASAKKYIHDMDANMGGTEIYHPLKCTLERDTIEGYQKQIFIMTDGEVSNVKPIIDLLTIHTGKCRVFSLGLGSSACHHLVNSMARIGNGTAMYAAFDEKLEKKILRQLSLALKPSLSDVALNWSPTVPFLSVPETPDPVFQDCCVVSFHYFKSLPEFAAGSAVRSVKDDGLLHRLASKRRIQDMQDGPMDCRETVIRLSLECNIASPHTSFVAVGTKTLFEKARVETVRVRNQFGHVPVPFSGATQTAGRGVGFFRGVVQTAGGFFGGVAQTAGGFFGGQTACIDNCAVYSMDEGDGCSDSAPAAHDADALVRSIVKRQRADGSFDLDQTLASTIGYVKEYDATAYVIAYLESCCMSSIDIWRLVVEKARRYLELSKTLYKISEYRF